VDFKRLQATRTALLPDDLVIVSRLPGAQDGELAPVAEWTLTTDGHPPLDETDGVGLYRLKHFRPRIEFKGMADSSAIAATDNSEYSQ